MDVHLVDGTYELFRAHFGAPPATAPDGAAVGATRGLLRSLQALLREPGVTHVAVAFDQVVESFRNRLFPGYKTAEGVPPELLAQFPLAEEATRALGLVTWPMVEFEADDALATGAARFADAPGVERVLLCTPDKDLAQCVRGTRVVGFDRMRRRVLDEAGVRARFGVGPASIPDWLALVGDTADGIPGVPRFGEKSASAVLGRYAHLEAIPDDAARWDLPVRAPPRWPPAWPPTAGRPSSTGRWPRCGPTSRWPRTWRPCAAPRRAPTSSWRWARGSATRGWREAAPALRLSSRGSARGHP